jgi:predicted nucleic acid-binding protein
MTSPTTNLVVLDTNIWSQLFSAGRQHVDAPLWRKAMVGLEVVVAQQTRAEVLYGLRFSTFSATKKAKVLAQLDATPTIPIDENVIQAWVDLRANCRLRRPTPHALQDAKAHGGDQWIGATAMSLGAPVMSVDTIFRDVPGLRLLPL